jgi:hypothetical protein
MGVEFCTGSAKPAVGRFVDTELLCGVTCVEATLLVLENDPLRFRVVELPISTVEGAEMFVKFVPIE